MPTGNQKTWAIAAFVLLLTVFCGAFWLSDSSVAPVSPAAHHERRAATADENHEKQQKEPFWKRATEDPVAAFTLILTGFTGVLAISTTFLWWHTRRLVVGAEDTAERQLRAYVSIKPGTIKTFKIGSIIEVEMATVNHGQTPAYRIGNSGAVQIRRYPLADFSVDGSVEEGKNGATLHRGEETRAVSSSIFPLSADEITILTSTDEMRLYVFAVATYRDIFDKKRTTQILASIPSADLKKGVYASPGEQVDLRFVFEPDHTHAT